MRSVNKALTKAKRVDPPAQKQPIRMSYETYAYLKSLVEDQKKKLERDFQTACAFLPSPNFVVKGVSAMDRAHEVFRKHYADLNVIGEQLHAAAQATYKDHPNPEMREFWGLTEKRIV